MVVTEFVMGTMGTGRALTLNQQGSPLTGKSEGLLPELLNRSIVSSMNLNNAINYHTDILEKSSPPLREEHQPGDEGNSSLFSWVSGTSHR